MEVSTIKSKNPIIDKVTKFSSHWHWDHIGDPSSFPHLTDLVVGPGFKEAMLPGAPANPESPIQESDYAYVQL